MKLIPHLTLQNMKHSRTRTLVTILGIVLSAAMFTAVITMGVSLRAYMMNSEIAERGDYFIRYDYGTPEDLERLRSEDAVTRLATLNTVGYTSIHPADQKPIHGSTFVIGAGDAVFFDTVPVDLEDGRLPQNSSEIVLNPVAMWALNEIGLPTEIGAQVTLTVEPSFTDTTLELPEGAAPFEKTYTIVGITSDSPYFGDYSLDLATLLTCSDGTETPIWGRYFVKMNPATAMEWVRDFSSGEKQFGLSLWENNRLLDLYGVTRYANVNGLIFAFVSVLILIIMVGSVSLIYNAFSISVSERTKQFGLLSSVGATRKQIRRCVLTEALFLSAAGIPLGILSGYAGIAVTLSLTHGLIDDLLISATENGVILKAVPSFPGFVAAAVVALITVLISAWIPARRATKVSPISAIRQQNDFKVPRRRIRSGALSGRLFGLPATLARKYYTVNRRKYRSTVISLTVSMVLFVSAGTFVHQMTESARDQIHTDNYDFEIDIESPGQLQKIRSHPMLKSSVLSFVDRYDTLIPNEDFTEGYTKAWEAVSKTTGDDVSITSKYVRVIYLEDDVLRTYCEEQGIDPAPYFDPEDPTALVPEAELTGFRLYSEQPQERLRFVERILKPEVTDLPLYPATIPEGVMTRLESEEHGVYFRPIYLDGGTAVRPVFVQIEDRKTGDFREITRQLELHPVDDHHYAFYFRDPETLLPEETPADTVAVDRTHIRIGESIRELPFGGSPTGDYQNLTLILPLSVCRAEDPVLTLRATAGDYLGFTGFLNENGYYYADYLEPQMRSRDLITMVRIFSYGFITLISLICICNVFNTISTNIALRKSDFGMLRSVGMKNRELHRMIAFECLQYGLKSLLWGVPLSLIASFGITSFTQSSPYLPLSSMAIAAGCIFLTVFITMFYAVSKLRKQNPMEAIRSE